MKTRLKSPDLYTIGWIAALPIERAAATALLHDRHDVPESFDQHRSDTNSYTWGRIGEHNVVIASLPAGVFGITSAATTVSNLIHTLPHIRIGLLVGIGGGIARPDEGQDIRLGDIVVSQPDGTTGGVVQYDLGKAKAEGGWERKGSLDKPPSVLLHALASLQAEHEIAPSKVPDLLQAILEANPGMTRPKRDFTYQGAENDRLFDSKHDHVGGSNCDKCDSTWEVKRDRRESSDPEIHYGIIASGNKLIKDAATRDSLFGDSGHQCLCVEMEAAGLMDRFPCLVIRGICDYADSHKNDRWQRYAAATAAAFAVELLEYVPVGLLEATQKIVEVIQSLEQRISSLSTPIHNIDYRTALNQLSIAEGASFDSKAEEHNPRCLPDTRQELLEDIDRWIDDSNSKTVYWLNGDLGASFFFKRGEVDRGNLNKLMSTLAYHLALSIPRVGFFVKKALDANPAIVGKSVKEQFEKLIQGPLSEAVATVATVTTPSSVVMVIDALDECDQEADIRLLINIFSQAKILRSRLRVFLTSRPELPIRLGFSEIQASYQDLVLHEIPVQIVEHDIVVFLDDEFRKIRHEFNLTVCDERKLPSDWPGRPTVQRLAQMAVPLFIFAATVCRFIGDRKRESPPIQLRKVLDYESKGHVSQFDRTYGPVLRSLITDVSEDDKKQIIRDLKIIVGSIIILANPLSVRALSQLLEVDPDVVDNRLDTLHSVLSIPPTREAPVRLLHLSFRDYLIANERTRRSTVDSSKLEEHIPLQLQYACMHWAYHQMEGDPKSKNSYEVHDFLSTHFLHWMEALSLMGRVKECLDSLRSLARWLENREDSILSTFVADAVRFLQAYFTVIAEAPLQIYSCLAFAPSKSVVRRIFEPAIPSWISNLPKVEESWDACLLTLEGHGSYVNSVVFSHDSKKVASGSADKTIRIWNVETGECERVLKGHNKDVSSVVFSYDSKKVASGSNDKTIRIWNAETGECERVLEGHSDWVDSVVFSHDSKKVASASGDKTIRIWNTETGKCEQELKGHSDKVNSVVFSRDSKKVASASWDKTIRIWDTQTGECERVLEGHSSSVSSVIFSYDSKKVASGSHDETIRIWDSETGECEQELKGHSSSVSSVIFSHDSKKVASASWDKTIRIWNTEIGKCERDLKGHSNLVISVVFSHDSKKVASASWDKTIRIWNAEIGECERVLEGHSSSVSSVIFSYDSKKVASGSSDKTIRIWNAETGACEDVIWLGHHASVLSFTPDERGIGTDHGVFALTGGSESREEFPTSLQSSETPILGCKDGTWVTTAGADLLWLPPECRNGEVAIAESTIVIGCPSGRVVLLGISGADIQ
ncbi:hypothetical protein AU210_016200 [Fusarium oxysporum f. sp. radicis-cucumerinum]|uniref:Mitochondrial division protein 1 n=1 Tax=Fusarium oxysporum f. sp. radicis-cucumerinum TaxID=327505 RepID=A0A2H3G4J4_FUSOX|nr:hypothetical protein AU210_016200 [Fusarium oxysporum f. sp. radicis-cucumerinum]